jgi:hypothetical protein
LKVNKIYLNDAGIKSKILKRLGNKSARNEIELRLKKPEFLRVFR